jgi:hypothetical protein
MAIMASVILLSVVAPFLMVMSCYNGPIIIISLFQNFRPVSIYLWKKPERGWNSQKNGENFSWLFPLNRGCIVVNAILIYNRDGNPVTVVEVAREGEREEKTRMESDEEK